MEDSFDRLPRGRHGLPPETVIESQRARLMAAAADGFAEHGFALTARQIATRARVSGRTLYEYFDGADAVLVAAGEAEAEWLLGEVSAACGDGGLEAAVIAGADLVVTDPSSASVLGLAPAAAFTGLFAVRASLVGRLAAAWGDSRRVHLVSAALDRLLAAGEGTPAAAVQVAQLLSRFD